MRAVASALGLEVSASAAEVAPWHPGRCAELSVDAYRDEPQSELHVDAYVLTDRAEIPLTGLSDPSTFHTGRAYGSWLGLAAILATALSLSMAGRARFRPPAGPQDT